MHWKAGKKSFRKCRPLREVVSWNDRAMKVEAELNRSTSSWGRELKFKFQSIHKPAFSSTSSWGRELKFHFVSRQVLGVCVDLFVRSWVEIASLYPLPGLPPVDLFVRSWVEIAVFHRPGSAVVRRPLREVVSWNRICAILTLEVVVDLFVRSWVEMSTFTFPSSCLSCRPLREVVSWNIMSSYVKHTDPLSTSSWGRELKFLVEVFIYFGKGSTSSWGRELKYPRRKPEQSRKRVDLFVRSWVEMFVVKFKTSELIVDLFVRSWVEIHSHRNVRCLPFRRPLREVVSWNIVCIW